MIRQENDKLIAEFMGYKLAKCNSGLAWEYTLSKKWIDDKFQLHGRLFDDNSSNYMRFNSSWTWLMQVVLKIEKLSDKEGNYYNVIIKNNQVNIKKNKVKIIETVASTKFTAIFEAVVEFINYYNEKI